VGRAPFQILKLGTGENKFNSKSCGAHTHATTGHHQTLSPSILLRIASSSFQSQAATAGFASHLPTSALFYSAPCRAGEPPPQPSPELSSLCQQLVPRRLCSVHQCPVVQPCCTPPLATPLSRWRICLASGGGQIVSGAMANSIVNNTKQYHEQY
jgi:hypothetical protein